MIEIPRVFDPYRMFDPRAWLDATPEEMLPHAAAVADALSRNRAYAALLNATTNGEALATRVYEKQLRFLLHVAGQSTVAERREGAERAARKAQLANGAARRQCRDVSGRRPRVFWHEAGDGEVVLLLNGWTASGLAWPSRWLASLSDQLRVIRIDNRGTGFSRTAPAPFTMAELADDAADVLDATGAGGATVLGSSMGGMIAQELAIRRPDLVERLILVATRPPSPAHLLSRSPVMLATLARPAKDEPVAQFQRRMWTTQCAPGFVEREPQRFDELMGQVSSRVTPRVAMINQLRAIAGWYGSDRLRRIRAPTIVVHGDADPMVPVGNGIRLAKMIPGARYVELAGVGHLPALEEPYALAQIILDHAERRPYRRRHR